MDRTTGPAVVAHVRDCPRCSALLRELAGAPAPEIAGTAARAERQRAGIAAVRPASGEVYALRAPERDELELAVVSSLGDREVEVLAIAEDGDLAASGDVPIDRSQLGFSAVLRTAVGGWVLPEQLDARLGSVTLDDVPLLAGPGRLELGASPDARERQACELLEIWRPYLEPARSLRETRTLGELLRLRQSQIGLSSLQVASAAKLTERDVDAIGADELDLLGAVRPEQLAGVLRRLSVLFSAKLSERIRLALAAGTATPARLGAARRVGGGGRSTQLRSECEQYLASVQQLAG